MTPTDQPAEPQTCPRRVGEFGPWEHKPDLDSWKADRWLADPAAVAARQTADDQRWLDRSNADRVAAGRPPQTMAEYMANVHRGPDNDQWKWSLPVPRTCSFCGGIHPEDAIRLVGEGWEVDATGKDYKRYLNPPGYGAYCDALMGNIRDGGEKPARVASPTPPVKVYVMHFSDEQVERFNAALTARKNKEKA